MSLVQNLHAVIDGYVAQHHFSGEIVVVKDQEVLLSRNIGFKDMERQEEFNGNTIFPIASVTKQFCAVAILMLYQDGKIDLQQPISSYLEEDNVIWQGTMPSWAKQITVHQLLINSTGLANHVFKAIFEKDSWSDLDIVSDENIVPAIITKIKDTPLNFAPGTKFEYSNTNYLLLSHIINQLIPGSDFSHFLAQKLFSPLGMASTTLPSMSEERAYIYDIYANKKLPKRYMVKTDALDVTPGLIPDHGFNVPLIGGGAMFSNTVDLLKWNMALYNNKIIAKDTLQLMISPHMEISTDSSVGTMKYGYGLMIDVLNGKPLYRHPGRFLGLRTELSYNPQNHVSVVLLSNISPDCNQSLEEQNIQDKALMDLVTDLNAAI